MYVLLRNKKKKSFSDTPSYLVSSNAYANWCCKHYVLDFNFADWFRTVQALEVLGMVAGATALLMIILFSFVSTCAENKMLKIFTLIGCVIACKF